MTLVYLLMAVLVIAGAALVLLGRWDAGLPDTDRPGPEPLPEAPWRAADVERLRFRVGLRGYRMEDVDAALAALAAELRRRDEEEAAGTGFGPGFNGPDQRGAASAD